jgi:hypothetical protein
MRSTAHLVKQLLGRYLAASKRGSDFNRLLRWNPGNFAWQTTFTPLRMPSPRPSQASCR